jgi:phage virion morphogenesis protein
MAGGRISVDFDGIQALSGLRRLQEGMEQTAPLMAQISEYLWRSTRDRFKTQTGPDDKAWKTLQPRYKEGKPKAQRERILTLMGYLRERIVKDSDARSATVGSDRVYAAIHQFGGRTSPHVIAPRYKKALAFNGVVRKSVQHPGSNIPARPFLGLSDADRKEIGEITLDFLQRRM